MDGGARLSSSNTDANFTVTLNDIPVYVSCSQSTVMESVGMISCDVTRGLDANGNSVGTFPLASSLTISTQDLTAASQLDYLAIGKSYLYLVVIYHNFYNVIVSNPLHSRDTFLNTFPMHLVVSTLFY